MNYLKLQVLMLLENKVNPVAGTQRKARETLQAG